MWNNNIGQIIKSNNNSLSGHKRANRHSTRGRETFFWPPFKKKYLGARKCVLYSTMTKLPYQFRIFLWTNFLYGVIHSVWGKSCVRKILNYISGTNFFFWIYSWSIWFFFSSYFYSTKKNEIIQIKNHNLLCSLDTPNQSWLFWLVGLL